MSPTRAEQAYTRSENMMLTRFHADTATMSTTAASPENVHRYGARS